MPKKDTATAVLGMLSNAGAQTRSTVQPERPAAPVSVSQNPAPVEVRPTASVSSLPPVTPNAADAAAPRTLRLRADTAQQLRSAWLEAKRDDVLLTAQDYASNLVEEALATRRRRDRTTTSG